MDYALCVISRNPKNAEVKGFKMGFKSRPRMFKVALTEDEVTEIYNQLCRSHVGYGVLLRLLRGMRGWMDDR